MTATATKKEEKKIIELCDLNDPLILKSSPVTKNHMYFKVMRPPSVNGFRGKGDEKPNTSELISRLALDKFIDCVKNGKEPKITLIFVQSYQELIFINNYLTLKLHGVCPGKCKPWIMNSSSVGKLTKIENEKRIQSGEIKLYITTRDCSLIYRLC